MITEFIIICSQQKEARGNPWECLIFMVLKCLRYDAAIHNRHHVESISDIKEERI